MTSNASPVFHFQPEGISQKKADRAFPEKKILILCGGAGTGKTHTALALAIKHYLSGQAKKIWVTRPAVLARGEDLGHLPGSLDEKYDPYLLPLNQVRNNMVYSLPDKVINPLPLAYMRGITFTDSVAILDEAQNCPMSMLRLFLSRFGKGSKLILTGDPDQSDLPPGISGFKEVCQRLDDLPEVEVIRMLPTENFRDPLVPVIEERLR